MHYRDTAGRVAPPRLVKRSDAPSKPRLIVGYSAVFYRQDDPGTEYVLLDRGSYRIVERLMPTAFNSAVRNRSDVRALFNHNPDAILGRTASGTLRLSTDGIGLRYEVDIPATTIGADVAESLRRGDVSGSSFSFDYGQRTIREQVVDGVEVTVIEVEDLTLYDVGPVVFPAYSSATAGVRSGPQLAGRCVIGKGEMMRRRAAEIEAELRR